MLYMTKHSDNYYFNGCIDIIFIFLLDSVEYFHWSCSRDYRKSADQYFHEYTGE